VPPRGAPVTAIRRPRQDPLSVPGRRGALAGRAPGPAKMRAALLRLQGSRESR